mmetsp:Transcript_47449/g.111675  ORF Transcript_47449/g.111675 Transcript_47449/m.111675 type:complete len:205 (+) Transcript_47449:791-1405(+)
MDVLAAPIRHDGARSGRPCPQGRQGDPPTHRQGAWEPLDDSARPLGGPTPRRHLHAWEIRHQRRSLMQGCGARQARGARRVRPGRPGVLPGLPPGAWPLHLAFCFPLRLGCGRTPPPQRIFARDLENLERRCRRRDLSSCPQVLVHRHWTWHSLHALFFQKELRRQRWVHLRQKNSPSLATCCCCQRPMPDSFPRRSTSTPQLS